MSGVVWATVHVRVSTIVDEVFASKGCPY